MRSRFGKFLFGPSLIVLTFLIHSCKNNKETTEQKTETVPITPSVPLINYTIDEILPHDENSFTEGFLFHNGQLFESTGSPENLPQTKSEIGVVDLKTGKLNVKVTIDRNKYFGEGIVFFKDKLYQLTYKNKLGFIYDAKTFKHTGEFHYMNEEGWGFTTDGTYLIMSDGTSKLTFLDPVDLKVAKTLSVTDNGYPENSLNELEYIQGSVYANVWGTNVIVKIDPSSGKITGKLDLTDLNHQVKQEHPEAAEMNGIAYDSSNDKIYITGKLWPHIYRVTFPL